LIHIKIFLYYKNVETFTRLSETAKTNQAFQKKN